MKNVILNGLENRVKKSGKVKVPTRRRRVDAPNAFHSNLVGRVDGWLDADGCRKKKEGEGLICLLRKKIDAIGKHRSRLIRSQCVWVSTVEL